MLRSPIPRRPIIRALTPSQNQLQLHHARILEQNDDLQHIGRAEEPNLHLRSPQCSNHPDSPRQIDLLELHYATRRDLDSLAKSQDSFTGSYQYG